MSDAVDLGATVRAAVPPPPSSTYWTKGTATLTLTASQLAYMWALVGNATGETARYLLGDAADFSTYSLYLALDKVAADLGVPTLEIDRRNVDITIRKEST